MSTSKLKSGMLTTIKVGSGTTATVIGYGTSLSFDANYSVIEAQAIGSVRIIEQQISGYKATVQAEYFIDQFERHVFSDVDANGKVLSTAAYYNFKTPAEFDAFLKAEGNRIKISVYSQASLTMDTFIKLKGEIPEYLLFEIDNCLLTSESIRINTGDFIKCSSSFTTIDPILNTDVVKALVDKV